MKKSILITALTLTFAGASFAAHAEPTVTCSVPMARVIVSTASKLNPQLTSALLATGCFEIQERESIDAIKAELALVGKTLNVIPAEYLITASQSTEGSVVVSIVDVAHAKILKSAAIQAPAPEPIETSKFLGFFSPEFSFAGKATVSHSATETASRDVITQAADWAAQNVPKTARNLAWATLPSVAAPDAL